MPDGQVLGPIGVARLADETVIGGSLAIDALAIDDRHLATRALPHVPIVLAHLDLVVQVCA